MTILRRIWEWHASIGLALGLFALLAGCSKRGTPNAPGPSRSYYMGFAGIPPRPAISEILATIDLWSTRADVALISGEPPWDSLLAGIPAEDLVRREQLPLANYYRGRGLGLIVNVDPTNGLDRSSDSSPLVAAGRSLTEPAIQQLFRDYAVAMDTLLRPSELGLASETNLIRSVAPPALYAALVQVANDAVTDVRAHDHGVRLFHTVQVEVAWGRLTGSGYQGISQDRADFPFAQTLGLSSYPYLGGYAAPESLPADYYSRLVTTQPLPVMVIEGGWSSETVTSNPGTPELQRRYIHRHSQLLDGVHAVGWFQLTFTDLDLSAWPPSITPFAYLGLVDQDYHPKPALAEWDAVFARPRR